MLGLGKNRLKACRLRNKTTHELSRLTFPLFFTAMYWKYNGTQFSLTLKHHSSQMTYTHTKKSVFLLWYSVPPYPFQVIPNQQQDHAEPCRVHSAYQCQTTCLKRQEKLIVLALFSSLLALALLPSYPLPFPSHFYSSVLMACLYSSSLCLSVSTPLMP